MVSLISLFLFTPPAIRLMSGHSLEERAEAATQFLALTEHLWPAIAISMVIMGLVSIYITHHLAGPIYRIEQTIKGIINRDISVRIKPRKRDDLKPLADLLNQGLENLDGSMREIKIEGFEMGKIVDRVLSGLKMGGVEGVTKMDSGTDWYPYSYCRPCILYYPEEGQDSGGPGSPG